MSIRNIIFDLGGVFIDIHYHKTRDAFTALGIGDFDSYFQQSYSNPLFSMLETGDVGPTQFYDAFRQESGLDIQDEALEAAWNAMLGDFRPASIAVLPELKQQYQLYLLSNTNQIHHHFFSAQYRLQFGGREFDEHFHKAYYSHLLGLRKPHVGCYQKVLDLHGMLATETLFIDDTPKNIEGAKQAGLQTLLLLPGNLLEEALKKVVPFA